MYKNIIKILFGFILFSLVSSCYKKKDIENTGTVNMSGEWWAEYYLDEDPAEPVSPFTAMLTYNTSDNTSSQMWIEEHFWSFKSKANIDYSSLSFTETASTENLDDAGTFVKILEGKVLKNAGHTQTGNIVDSIFLRVEFLDDDPGVVYQIRGHMKSGFIEDEY